MAQMTANIRNSLLPGTLALQAQSALSVGTTADDVTPADHMIALAMGLACCIEAFSAGGTGNPEAYPAGLRWLFEHLPFFGVQTV